MAQRKDRFQESSVVIAGCEHAASITEEQARAAYDSLTDAEREEIDRSVGNILRAVYSYAEIAHLAALDDQRREAA